MTGTLHDTLTTAPRRSDAGAVRLGRRARRAAREAARHHSPLAECRAGRHRAAGTRPGLLIRAAVVAGLCLGVLVLIPGQPAAPADITGLAVFFALTARSDLAPPPRR
jgi:hypothetical protein